MVFRVVKNQNYTVLSNYHFKDKTLSLKAKGLLSLMLSLPEEWDYSIAGLVTLSTDGETSVRNTLTELEEHNYLKRNKIRENGKIIDWEYLIFEMPTDVESVVDFQQVGNQVVGNQCQLNTQISNTKKENKDNIKEDQESFLGSCKPKSKQKKQSLYDKCYAEILAFTNNAIIQNLLTEYLKFRLSVKDKPLYFNQWRGMLNKLSELSEGDADTMRRLAQQSLEKTWLSFYPLSTTKSNSVALAACESNVRSDRMTEDDYEKQSEFIDRMKKEGKMIEF